MSDPAAALITLCVREPDALTRAAIGDAFAAIDDWRSVVETATRHRVAAYVRQGLNAAHVRVPPDTNRELGSALLVAAARVVGLSDWLRRVASELSHDGIPLLVLKGPVLGPWLYPSVQFRPYSDLDIEVPPEHFDAAVTVLMRLGLVEQEFAAEVARQEHGGHVHAGAPYHRIFVSTDGRAVVELHADALQLGMQLSSEYARWARAVPAPTVPGAVMLSPADQLVHLAVHAHKHGFDRLIWLKDLDLLVRHGLDSVEWERAIAIAEEEGVRGSVWYALELVQCALGTPLPGAPFRRLQPSPPMRALYRRVWPKQQILELSGHMRRRAVQFHVAESWRGMLPSLILMGRRRTRARAIMGAILHGAHS